MLGTRIAQRRVELRLSQKELANQAGISVTYLNELERNKRFPSARICVDIANTLHVPMDYLLQDISRGGRIYRLSEYSKKIRRLNPSDQNLILTVMAAMISRLD
ncbi:MAG: helix-turn-helix domain-containing protein [Acutalibacteraceae bacterium]